MPLTASQSGLGAAQGHYTDDQSYRNINSSTTRPSPHPHPSQSQTQPHQHQYQPSYDKFVPSSTSPSPKQKQMTTTTTKKAAIGRQRERTHSNSTSVIDPSALQYASKFSSSNNNVIVTSTMVGFPNVSAPSNSTVVLPQGSLNLQSHHHNTSTYASSNSSTTTTFYSGVKLAPPVLSASVEQLERRASDQKIWYTIQVCPCDLTIITPASTSASTSTSASSSTGPAFGASSGGCSGGFGEAVTSIPRKPYKIYRRYEDVADFADQLEEEFTGRMVAPSAGIGLQHNTKDSNAVSTAMSTSGGGFGSSSYCVNVSCDNIACSCPAPPFNF
ncbi:MAG: hypothetical protein JOS17DRAFT_726836 [Linnemannia elongata]|nr:MAG: hypothetical protein JOS17DRAFT_726836 [Linnemannia elongata]